MNCNTARIFCRRKKYTSDDIKGAAELVREEDYSLSQAAKLCNVPWITLHDHLHRYHRTGKVGWPNVLTEEEEAVIADAVVLRSKYNCPVNKRIMKNMVKAYLEMKEKMVPSHVQYRYKYVLVPVLNSQKNYLNS